MTFTPRTMWLLIFLGFTLLGGLNTTHLYLDDLTRGHHGTLFARVVEEFTGVYGSLALLPMVIWFARRFDLGRNFPGAIPGHIAGWLLYTTLHTTWDWGSRIAIYWIFGHGWYDYGTMIWRYPMEAAGDFLDYCLALGMIYLITYMAATRHRELKEAELEGKLAEAKLENLRLQLQPHFLFNTLNAISSVMYEDVGKADKMLAQVSDFMRLVLDSAGVQSVPVDEELRVERMYVDIMKTRLERNLRLSIDLDDEARNALVPFMLLQPLLENSIRHGMGSVRGSIDLDINVARANGSTVIRICDDGIGFPDNAVKGIGLSNISERLEHMYGQGASFSITARPEGGTVATVMLPYLEGSNA